MEPAYDPILSRKVITDIQAAIQASIASKGAPAPLSIPHDAVPLERKRPPAPTAPPSIRPNQSFGWGA